jgi:hypothetical protein
LKASVEGDQMPEVTKIYKWRIPNLLGLQISRVLVARLLNIARRRMTSRRCSDEKRLREFKSNGYLIVKNFLDDAVLEMVRGEFLNAIENQNLITKKVIDTAGQLRTSCTVSTSNRWSFTSTVKSFRSSELINNIISDYDGRHDINSSGCLFQLSFWRTENQPSGDLKCEFADHTNTEVHSDSFQSVIKCFFYLQDVNDGGGAHIYYPKSHRLSLRRLVFDYVNSVTVMRDSPRLDKSKMWAISRPPIAFKLPANTLIIVDTYGFHAQEPVMPGRHRDIVYLQFRSPPFS